MAKLLQVADSLEMNELHRAVQENRLEAVKFLVKSGADVTYPINRGQSPLYIAVKNNCQDITEVLCKSKSRIEVRKMIDRQTLDTNTGALHVAANNNSLESTRFLLSCGAHFEICDKESRQIQDLTTDESIKELAKSIKEIFQLTEEDDNQGLLEKLNSCPGENMASVIYARNEQRRNWTPSLPKNHTALQMAMKRNNMGRVEIIANFRIDKLKQNDWQAGAKIDKLVRHSKAARRHFSNLSGYRWHKDSEYRKREVIDLLHNSFAFLEAYKEQGNLILEDQPLLIIIEEGLEHFEYWEDSRLMKKSVDKLLNSGDAEQMLKLCVIGPMLLFMRLVYTSELLEAAKQNDLAKVEMYLTGHPDLNKTDESNGWTALHYAINRENENIAKLLLNFGADPTIASKNTDRKETPLNMALHRMESRSRPPRRSWYSPDVLLLLFENTGDDRLADYINAQTERDRSTPLHLAVKQNNYRLVEFLLRKGCVYCSKDTSNKVPSDYLYLHNNEVISNLVNCTERSFAQARDGKVEELLQAMSEFDTNTLLAVGGARDEKNRTLDQVLDLEGHSNEADVVRKMLADAKGSK